MKDVTFYRQKWFEIHTYASQVVLGQISHRDFCRWMRSVPDQLPCKICKKHCIEYLNTYPPESEWNVFIWAFTFHNSVNQRKGKPLYSYNVAIREYGL
jgi:hypothetical protein